MQKKKKRERGGGGGLILVGTSCAGIIIPVVTMLRPVDHLVFV